MGVLSSLDRSQNVCDSTRPTYDRPMTDLAVLVRLLRDARLLLLELLGEAHLEVPVMIGWRRRRVVMA